MSSDELPSTDAVTQLLSRLRSGDGSAVDQLLPLVYGELRRLAGGIFSRESPNHTLQPTALVHEAWLKLAGHIESIEDRRHFLVVAGKAMRQVIHDHARGKQREKRGGDRRPLTLDADLVAAKKAVDLIELDDSLRRLAENNARHAEVAEMRLLSGLSIDEIAELLELSTRTIDSDWAMARAWLRRELGH